jgi:hypothetical protein
MIGKLIIFLFAILFEKSITALGQQVGLAVLQQPSHYSFDNSDALKLSDFKNLLLAGSGFTIKKPVEWKGLISKNSLSIPRVTLLFVADNKKVDINAFTKSVIQVNQDTDVDFDYLNSLSLQSNTAVRSFDELPAEIDSKVFIYFTRKNLIFQ